MSGAEAQRGRWPVAFLVEQPGTDAERPLPIHDYLVIGRECAGVDESHRLVLDDGTVSRRHAEIRLDPAGDRACIFDISTNGTRVNGSRVERASEVQIRPGDRLSIGGTEFQFRSDRFQGLVDEPVNPRSTVRSVSLSRLAMAAGDVIGYSTISQYTEEHVVLQSIDSIYSELRRLVEKHNGRVNNYVGDAFFAIWEADGNERAAEQAVTFALAAAARVSEMAEGLPIRDADGKPVRMGWGVEIGKAAISTLTGMHVAVLGDATNVAFRLSTAAGRGGRLDVVASHRIQQQLADRFEFTDPEEITLKGRSGAELIFGVRGQRPAGEGR